MARNGDSPSRIDRDGVRTAKHGSSRGVPAALAGIATIAALTIGVMRWLSVETSTAVAPVPVASSPTPEQREEWASVKEIKPTRAAGGERRDEPAVEEPLPEIDARDVINALVEAGETGGIAAFPPPGTDPVKRGIIVPDDYELPEGYVRHHQSTDDGKDVEPILMFSPDYEFRDQDGRVIPLPDDLVVPPELAPPGLPIRTLDVPESGAGTSR